MKRILCGFVTARGGLALILSGLPVATSLGQAVPPTVSTASPTTASVTLYAFPSYGISLPMLPGFTRDIDSQMSVAIFIAGDREQPDDLFEVDVIPLEKQTLDDYVNGALKAEGLARVIEPASWGGEQAVSLTSRAASGGDKLVTTRVLLCKREHLLYRMRHAARGGRRADKTFDFFAAETQWTPVATAGRGVLPRKPLLWLANGARVSLPDPFRPAMDEKGTKHVVVFNAFDLRSQKRAAQLLVVPLPNSVQQRTLATLQAETLENLSKSMGIEGDIKWEALPGNRPDAQFAITPSLTVKSGKARLLIAIQNESATVFSLQLPPGSDAESDAGMNDVLPLIADSMRASATTRPISTTP